MEPRLITSNVYDKVCILETRVPMHIVKVSVKDSYEHKNKTTF